MKHSCEICLSEIYSISTLEPRCLLLLLFFHRKYRYLHAFLVIVCLLDHVDYVESPLTLLDVPEPKKKPYVVSVCVDIVLNHQEVLICIRVWYEGPAEITALKISIDTVLQ